MDRQVGPFHRDRHMPLLCSVARDACLLCFYLQGDYYRPPFWSAQLIIHATQNANTYANNQRTKVLWGMCIWYMLFRLYIFITLRVIGGTIKILCFTSSDFSSISAGLP